MAEKVIIFGPTGNIGSVAALTASDLGAKVVLAMRDPQKDIPGLSAEKEKTGGFERVQADLQQPDSVADAVKKTGAKHAFFYLAIGSQDGMKATIQALKSAGIEFVVFLSSYTVVNSEDLSEIPPEDLIPYWHAQVEINIQEIFGKENYVAIRPGHFATNILTWTGPGIRAGALKQPYPDAMKNDYITPKDMGRVSGNILVKGKQEKYAVYLFGPEIHTPREAIKLIGKAVSKDIEMTPIYGDDALEEQKKMMPAFIAEYIVKNMKAMANGEHDMTKLPYYDEGRSNVEKYSGKPAQKFQEWVDENKSQFQ